MRALFKPPRPVVNPSNPQAKGLTAAYSFTGGGNTIFDRVTGLPAIFQGTPPPVWQPGLFGPALYFDGANSYIHTQRIASDYITASRGTIMAWAKPTAAALSGGSVFLRPALFGDGQ